MHYVKYRYFWQILIHGEISLYFYDEKRYFFVKLSIFLVIFRYSKQKLITFGKFNYFIKICLYFRENMYSIALQFKCCRKYIFFKYEEIPRNLANEKFRDLPTIMWFLLSAEFREILNSFSQNCISRSSKSVFRDFPNLWKIAYKGT